MDRGGEGLHIHFSITKYKINAARAIFPTSLHSVHQTLIIGDRSIAVIYMRMSLEIHKISDIMLKIIFANFLLYVFAELNCRSLQ